MALFIVQIQVDGNGKVTNRKRLPGDYGDGQKAMQALEKHLAKYYKSHGRDDQHGHLWARDDKGTNVGSSLRARDAAV